jgi:hypothetical protein
MNEEIYTLYFRHAVVAENISGQLLRDENSTK